MYTHTHTYIHTHTHIYTHIYTHTHTYIHTHTHIYTHTYIHIHIYTYIHICIYTHTHIYTHIYIHTYTHIYTHTYTQDNQEEDAETHSQIRKMVNEAPGTQDDEKFTLQEVSNTIQSMGEKGHRRRRNYERGVEMHRRNIAQVSNSNLQWLPQGRNFSEKVEESKVNTHSQTGQRRK